MRILLATQKPFSAKAVAGIREIVEKSGNELVLLEKYPEQKDLVKAVEDVDALIIRSDKITQEVIDSAKKLKIVVRAGAGYDNVDLAAASARNIVVMNTPGQNSNAVAELAISMMIFMSRNQFNPGTGSEIMGKRLGIQAFGNIGKLVAKKALGMGMEVVALDPMVSSEVIKEYGVGCAGSVEELYSTCDFVSVHTPATPQTIKSIGYELVSKMPKGACLINTARKEVIDEEGLEKALEERQDLKYITDIAPSNADSLREKFGTRFFATSKKMGAETAEANVNAGLAAARQIVDFFTTGNTKFQVNK